MLILTLMPGCFAILGGMVYDPAAAQAQVDAAILQQVAATRSAYEAAPSCTSAHNWAGMVQAAIEGGLYARGSLTLAEIDAAIAALPETGADAWMCLADRGSLYAATARPTEAVDALDRSLAQRQGAYALGPLLALQPEQTATRCKAAYAAQKTDQERLLILDTCAPYDAALAWAPASGRSLYEKELAARAQRQAEREAAAAAQAAATPVYSYSASPPSSSPSASTAPSGPTVTSVRLHSDCPQTVRLFFGDKPKYGSGTTSTLGSNTTTSMSMKPGDMIWLVDANDNGLSSVSVSGSSMSVDILSSCTGFRVH